MGSVSGDSVIKKINSSYFCCHPIIKFDLSCDNIWEMNDMVYKSCKRSDVCFAFVLLNLCVCVHLFLQNFAHLNRDAKQCVSPCKTIKDDQMILDGCFNVTVTTVCDVKLPLSNA